MTGKSAEQVARELLELRLLTREQLEAALAELTTSTGTALLEHLERKLLLSPFQIKKIERGEKTGYFLGRFKLMYRISAGTFARVFRGLDLSSGQVVAIKVLRGRHTVDPKNIQQFHREAKLTKTLTHPNITRTLEVGVDADTNQHYIAMEFVEGGNLREFLKIRKFLEPPEAVRLGCQMVEGLRYALSRGVTHRDIKPTNILISAGGQIKWVDFGLAGIVEDDGAIGSTEQRTVDYGGLEKATGAPRGDPRSDIFFLGTVFYQMLTGQPAIPATNRRAHMLRPRFDQIKKLASDPTIPPKLAAVVDRMLEFRPQARYQNYENLLQDLQAVDRDLSGNVEAPVPAAVMAPSGAPRIIVVHRSHKIQEILRDKLSEKGYQVVLTSDMQRALKLHELKPAQCMVVDLDTAGREGVDAYAKLHRRKSSTPKCAAIFLAEESQKSWASGFEGNSVAVLEKPITLGPVYDAIRKMAPAPAS